jgi:hypothetical protein
MNDKQLAQKAQDSLTRLAKNPDFVEWLKLVRMLREAAIESMEGASSERLHQITGYVTAYQAILNNGAAYAMLAKADKPE